MADLFEIDDQECLAVTTVTHHDVSIARKAPTAPNKRTRGRVESEERSGAPSFVEAKFVRDAGRGEPD